MELKLRLIKIINEENWKNKAMEIIWEKYYQPLYYYICSCFKLSFNAEDIVQDIMVKIFNNIDKINFKRSVKTYIYRVTRNHCIDIIKSNKGETQEYDDNLPQIENHVEHTILAKELEEKIDSILSDLPDDIRETAFLRFYVNKSYKDIAKITNVNVQIVKNRIYQVRKKIKENLREYL